jgi:cyclase
LRRTQLRGRLYDHWWEGGMMVRHTVVRGVIVAWGIAAVVCAFTVPPSLLAQSADEWRVRFAAGEQARQAGDNALYAEQMSAAAEALPADALNRPYIQYHAARASALVGDSAEAIRWLRTAWDEDIESLMISFAPFDPAFEAIVDSRDFTDIMGLAAQMELTVRPLGPGVHLITGAGANVVLQVGSDGVFLVDTGYRPAYPAVLRAIESVTDSDVTRLLVTHPHEDHMGATPDFGPAAVVMAHPATTTAMGQTYEFMDGVSMPPKAAGALPDVEISSDTSFVFNGEQIRVMPTVAHTAGDLSIYFTEAHVAHFGDSYLASNPMMFPGADDPDAFLDRLDDFLDSMDPGTVVVGGHEEVADLAAVRDQLEVTRACMAFVRASLEQGLSIEETAERGMDRFPPQWVAFFYALFGPRQ